MALCFGFVFRFFVSVSFLFNCLISFWGSLLCLVVLLIFVLFGSVFVSSVCVRVSLFLFLFDFTFYHLFGVLLDFFFFFLIPSTAGMSNSRGLSSLTGNRA